MLIERLKNLKTDTKGNLLDPEQLIKAVRDYRSGVISPICQLKLLADIGFYPVLKFFNKNRLFENSDIECEYWLGVSKALYKVDLYRRDTIISYIRGYAIYKVRHYMYKTYNKFLIGKCTKCGKLTNFNRGVDNCVCGGEFKFIERILHEKNEVDIFNIYGAFHPDMEHNIDFEQLMSRIENSLNGRQLEVFRLCKDSNVINAKNYMKAIADLVDGKITPQCVNIYLNNKIKKKVLDLQNEN